MDETRTTTRSIGPGGLLRAVAAAVAGAVIFREALGCYGAEGLFGDAYSHVIYWHDLLAGRAGALSPTITTPKPLAVVVTGLAWDAAGGAAGVRLVWIVLGGLALGLVWLITERLAAGAEGGHDPRLHGARRLLAALLATLLAAHWMVRVPLVFEARTALLAAVFLLAAVERALARGRPGVTTGLSLGLAGLVRPEAWAVAAVWTLAAVISRLGRRSGDRMPLIAPLLALGAPVLWIVWDLAVFGDPLFSRHATAHWQSVLRPDAATPGFREILSGLASWGRAAVGRFGAGQFLLALAGVWVAGAGGGRRLCALLWGGGIWTATIVALGLAGYTSSHRFLDPLLLAAWAPAGLALAAAFGVLLGRSGRAAWLAAGILAVAVVGLAAADFDERRATARRLDEPVVAMRARLRRLLAERPELAERPWLVDNDLGSRLALETPLEPGLLVTLQAVRRDEIEGDDWAGLIIDDRLQPRRRNTPEAKAIATLVSRGAVRYQGPACALITLDGHGRR